MIKQWHIQVFLAICIVITLLLLLRRSEDSALVPSLAVRSEPITPRTEPLVSDSAEVLLDRYEQLLSERAPKVLAALQPGLTDPEITALETKHSIKLTPDLRALYRWHNGIPRTTLLAAFPNHRFPPLDEVFAERAAVQADVKKQSALQRLTIAAFVGQRINWLPILPDNFGDGYFFDPSGTATQGKFLYSMLENPPPIYYPSFRSYLAELLEGYETGVYRFDASGAATADFAALTKLRLRYGSQAPN